MAKDKDKTAKRKTNALGSPRFAKGNQHGKKSRNPEATRKLDLVEIFKAAVSFQDIKDIAKQLVKKAKEGDTKAAQQVLDRCLGKVKEQVSLSLSGDTQDFLDYMGENYGGLPG